MDNYTYDETSPTRAQVVASPANIQAEQSELCTPEYESRALLPAESRQQNRPMLSFGLLLSRGRSARSRR